MTDEFFRTRMGHTYYNGTLPQFVREVGRLADSIAALNETLLERVRVPVPRAPPAPAQSGCERLRVLVVGDDECVLRSHARMLKKEHEVLHATSADAALAILGSHDVDALITAHCVPETDGLWLLEQARARHPHVRRILMSGQPPELDRHIESGLVQAFVPKPAFGDELVASLHTAAIATQEAAGSSKRCEKCGAAITDPQLDGDERCARCGDDP